MRISNIKTVIINFIFTVKATTFKKNLNLKKNQEGEVLIGGM